MPSSRAGRGLRRRWGGGDEDQVEADLALDLVDFDFREDRLFLDAAGVVAAAVEGLRGNPAEVADVRRGDVDETVQELPHAGAAQGDAGAEDSPSRSLKLATDFFE
jgi:hypothetical protein